jgi:hypothetical protein
LRKSSSGMSHCFVKCKFIDVSEVPCSCETAVNVCPTNNAHILEGDTVFRHPRNSHFSFVVHFDYWFVVARLFFFLKRPR